MPDRGHDWEIIGARNPSFGALTSAEFRLDKVDAATRRHFYAFGESEMATVLDWFEADAGERPCGGSALDIGCGVGRLTHAIAAHVQNATGCDVAESMLHIAREGAPANASFTSKLPAGPFIWINSYIAFQRIPPAEGLALLLRMRERLAPRAFISIRDTGWADAPPPQALLARLRRWRSRRVQRKDGHDIGALIQMHAYNFSDVTRVFVRHGFTQLVLRHTDHGGHHGAWFIARRG